MPLRDLFAKPVDRPIEGVIKADDEASLRLELDEYVLTNEVAKRLESFLAAYNHPGPANGVWISGFFGSGKSHLLKMLALVLENQELDGRPALDLFLPKCGDNEILRADLKRAVEIPSKSVLFNIDQKADVITKGEFDAVLAVFMKVFDDMRGYYGRLGYVARFERDLDRRGLLSAFQEAFKEEAGLPWSSGRETPALEAEGVSAAYASVSGTSSEAANGILDKYRNDYKLSIGDFAEEVAAYVEAQGPDFRLLFLVDEVGQYVGDNVKLMTNLQTVAESLATKCPKRAWILVTAQEDMSTLMGDSGAFQSDDFSKIQDRFKIRLKLTSANVSEVIRKRLLLKNDTGIGLLSDLYEEERNNFRTLFDFADGSQAYQNFRDRDEFIHSYPFVPYQYSLFQASIQSLSTHSAFEGRHTAVGERSMLGVFQDVAKAIAESEVGQLATFDMMFEGIRTALKARVQRSILTAEEHLANPFAVKVLKALFLVKYVREFKATLRNLTVLMIDHFDASIPDLKERIEGALNLLESQTYIQRNGDLFEYLTDEEKDVEEEIKHTDVDASSVSDELGKLIFDGVLGTTKIRYEENKQDFPFARKLDERVLSRDQELAIHIISPFHEHAEAEDIVRAHSLGRDELLVILPASERLVRDLKLYKQTDRYVRQNITSSQNDTVRRILTDKQVQNQQRRQTLNKLVSSLIRDAKLVVGGQDLDIAASEPRGRLQTAFQQLVSRTYPNLRMLREQAYKESDIPAALNPSSSLFSADDTSLTEPEREVLAHVKLAIGSGHRPTLHTLVQAFERKPYGWHIGAIICMLAKLCARGKVELKRDSLILEGDELEGALKNSHGYSKVVIAPQLDFTASQLRNLKDFHADFFDGPPAGSDAKTVAQDTGRAFADLKTRLDQALQLAAEYPFATEVAHQVQVIDDLIGQPYAFYLTELGERESELLDLKEEVIEPFLQFMGGAKRNIYDDAQKLLKEQQPNLVHVKGDAGEAIEAILSSPSAYEGKDIPELKTLTESLTSSLDAAVEESRSDAKERLQAMRLGLEKRADFAALNQVQQAEVRTQFDACSERIDESSLIAVVREVAQSFATETFPGLLQRVASWASPESQSADREAAAGSAGALATVAEPPVQYVSRSTIRVAYAKAAIESEADMEEYLTALRTALAEALREGKRISV